MSEIKFILDGKTVTAAPGETIMQAAKKIGVEIPGLCTNGKVSRTTSCFVCVVKDKKTGRFLPSCSACPSEGQEIECDLSASDINGIAQRDRAGTILIQGE